MAIVMNEPEADACTTVLEKGPSPHLRPYNGGSSHSLDPAEYREEIARLIDELGYKILTLASARIAPICERWRR